MDNTSTSRKLDYMSNRSAPIFNRQKLDDFMVYNPSNTVNYQYPRDRLLSSDDASSLKQSSLLYSKILEDELRNGVDTKAETNEEELKETANIHSLKVNTLNSKIQVMKDENSLRWSMNPVKWYMNCKIWYAETFTAPNMERKKRLFRSRLKLLQNQNAEAKAQAERKIKHLTKNGLNTNTQSSLIELEKEKDQIKQAGIEKIKNNESEIIFDITNRHVADSKALTASLIQLNKIHDSKETMESILNNEDKKHLIKEDDHKQKLSKILLNSLNNQDTKALKEEVKTNIANSLKKEINDKYIKYGDESYKITIDENNNLQINGANCSVENGSIVFFDNSDPKNNINIDINDIEIETHNNNSEIKNEDLTKTMKSALKNATKGGINISTEDIANNFIDQIEQSQDWKNKIAEYDKTDDKLKNINTIKDLSRLKNEYYEKINQIKSTDDQQESKYLNDIKESLNNINNEIKKNDNFFKSTLAQVKKTTKESTKDMERACDKAMERIIAENAHRTANNNRLKIGETGFNNKDLQNSKKQINQSVEKNLNDEMSKIKSVIDNNAKYGKSINTYPNTNNNGSSLSI